MTSMKSLSGFAIFVLLASAVFAQGGLFAEENLKESQVIIVPASDGSTTLNISVLVFEPSQPSATGQTGRDVMDQWAQECAGEANRIACLQRKSLEYDSTSRAYQFNVTSIQGAHFVVKYFNPQGNAYRGLWTVVPGCEDVVADIEQSGYRPSEAGDVAVNYYVGQCNIAPIAGAQTTYIRATFVPQPDQDITQAQAEHTHSNARISPATEFAQALSNLVTSVSQAGGAGPTLPCVGVFMIMGLLFASLYFSGRSPISLLDITTPRLPSPKGVAAGGQILAPFGYTEMKRTVGAKAAAATSAITASANALRAHGDADTERGLRAIDGLRGTAGDRAAAGGAFDVAQGRRIASSIFIAGRAAGFSGRDLEPLTRTLPYHYGKAEHSLVQQILEKLESMGGRHALMAMTTRDYLQSQRVFQTLETLTAHPGIGQRSAMHYRLSSTLGKAFGSNRYASGGLPAIVMAGTDSTFRTARVMGRMTKAIVTEAPALARGTARTTMEMLGGARAVEELEARGRTSATAAWLAGQLQKHPSKVIVGAMFPINDKMAHMYRTLHNEALRDEMRYVLRQIYKKMGVKFDISAEELGSMGHIDMDILKRSNLQATAELATAEAEIRRILSNSAFSSQEKLAALTRLAETHGATIDHQMLAFSARLTAIEKSAEPEHEKFLSIQQAINDHNRVGMSVRSGGHISENAYVCHVGGDSLRGSQVWETMVLRTMIWDAENGFLRGGLREELLSARLNVANRLTGLNPAHEGALEQLPEHMRNATQLKAVAERNRQDLVQLFSEDGRKAFEQFSKGKNIHSATIEEMVKFMYGGNLARTGDIDPKSGRMTWRASDKELQLPNNYTMVDLKRHWVPELTAKENFAIGQWVESRFTKSYVPAFKASIEAELDRMHGSASWSVEQRGAAAKKLWVADQLAQDMEQRFNSHFGQNTYGTTRETTRFYAGVVAGFMEKALQEKGLDNNHPDRRFLETMDITNPKHLAKLNELMKTHKEAYQSVASRDMTYDEIARSNKAIVMLHEGGYAYYKKGMMLSDMDRVMAGETAIRDNKGVLRKFIPEEVPINFGSRDDLMQQYYKTSRSRDPNEWQPFVQAAVKWAKEGGYSYDKEKVLAHVLWNYAQTTHDYDRFWKESAVSVEAKRQVTPVAPSVLRFFGVEGHSITPVIKPFRDIGMHMGDYISKVALLSGGELHRASYDITPVSSQLRMHSFHLASKIQSGEILKGLSEAEQVAYRNVAAQHGAYVQVWQYAIDRNPWRMSTSFGTHQAWQSMFHLGPALPFRVQDNLRAYMGKGEYASFMAFYGFPMNLAGKMIRPYVGMLRGMQMSMQGYASKWDSTGDALRQWNYTEPRVLEAMQSLNPFSFRWFPGKTGDRIAKLNGMGGSLERHQLAGYDYLTGLRQAPQEIFLQKKGVYANARTEDVNPGETYYDYRMTMKADATMAEYLFRTKEAAYMYDKQLIRDAMDNTTRRTVSAEALAIRRDQELRGFGVLQNSLFGWANPVAFLWHMPMPIFPQSLTPKDIVSKYVSRSKYGHGEGFGAGVRRVAEDLARGTSRIMQPHRISMIVYCPRCGMSNYRGSVCKNLSCKQAQY